MRTLYLATAFQIFMGVNMKHLNYADLPLMGSHDVVVAGGGPAGCMAALAAARLGMRVLVVEQYGFLGGALTAQGVHPMMTFHAGAEQVIRGIPDELVQRLVQAGASPGHIADAIGYASSITPFDAEGLKVELEQMLAEAGAEVLFHAMLADADVDQGRIQELLVCTKSGLRRVQASVFVDGTGDGDLLYHTGAGYVQGRDSDGATQPMTTNFRVGNVDTATVKRYIMDHPDQFYLGDLRWVEEAPRLAVSGFYDLVQQARGAGEFPTDRKGILFFETQTPGEVNVNTTHIFGRDATEPQQLSLAEAEGRLQARQVYDFLRKWVPGFLDAVFLSTGFQIGVRESRRLRGKYTLTQDDLIQGRVFPDAVVIAGYPVDIHPPTAEDQKRALHAAGRSHSIPQGQKYQIPYRCLVSTQVFNLIATGRCLSAEHEALGAVRVTPIAMAVGQAAGAAAALAVKRGCSMDQVDTERLRQVLREQGAYLE